MRYVHVYVRGDARPLLLSPCKNVRRAGLHCLPTYHVHACIFMGVCENRDGWLVAWGFCG